MKRAATLVALALVAAGCGEARTASEVRRSFARHGIHLEAPRDLERQYRRYLARREAMWQTSLRRLAVLAPPADHVDDYVLFTSEPGDPTEDVSLNVAVYPDSAQALTEFDLTDKAALHRRGFTFQRDRNVVVVFKRKSSARMRSRIAAALAND